MLSLTHVKRPLASVTTAALALSAFAGGGLLLAAPAQAAVVGAVSISSPSGSSGTDSTLFGGAVNASCPAGTDYSEWQLVGPSFTTPFYLADGLNNGVGAQEFSGASVANIETANGAPLTTGQHQIVFQCFLNGTNAIDSYRVNFAYDNTGSGAWTASSATPDAVPGAVGKPTAAPDDASASVSWQAPGYSGTSAVTSYTLQVFQGGAQFGSDIVTGSATTSHVVSGLTNGTAYTFSVSATNASGPGDFSARSEAVTPQVQIDTVPGTPAAPTAVAGNGEATASWAAPSSDGGSPITEYEVDLYEDGVYVDTGYTGQTSIQATGLTNGRAYTFTVAAINAVGIGNHSAQSSAVLPRTVPGVPDAPSATAGHASAQVSWSAPASNGGAPISGYELQVWNGGTLVRTESHSGTSATVTSLAVSTAFTFKVAAKNAAGTGAFSAASSSVTPYAVAPGAPGVPVAAAGAGLANLVWSAPTSDGGAAITNYTVNVLKDGTFEKSVSSAGTSTTVDGLTNGATYTFQVAASNSAGQGGFSAASSGVVPRLATKLVITSSPTKLTYGVYSKVYGKATRANSTTPVPGQRVYLQVRRSGTTAYINVASVLTSSTGAVAFTYRPAYAINALRLVSSTGGAYLGSISLAKGVTTQRRVVARWSATSIRLGATSTLSGSVAPNTRGKTVYLQKKVGTRWVNVKSKVLSSTSTYSFAVKPTARGTYYYRVSIGASSGYVTSVGSAPALKVL